MRVLFALLAVLALLPVPRALADGAAAGNPFPGRRLFLDCEAGTEQNAARNNPWYYVRKLARDGHPAESGLIRMMAEVPTAKWFAGASVRPSPARMLERYLARVDDPKLGGPDCATPLGSLLGLPLRREALAAEHQGVPLPRAQPAARDPYVGSLPVMAVRAMVHSRCGGDQGAGRWNQVDGGLYKPWIDAFAAGLQRRWAGPFRYEFWAGSPWPRTMFAPTERNAVVILEPDALGLVSSHSRCSSPAARRNTLALLRYAAERLGSVPGVTTYIDAGSSAWVDALEDIHLLRAAGVASVRGFALNSTHFNSTRAELRYGNWIARHLGGDAHFVLNTAENANGALPQSEWKHGDPKSMWCNPKNSGLGQQPTADTGSPYADAFLWISRPGLSSNGKNGRQECGRGPLDNVFWAARALQEARQRSFSAPAWPPRAL